MYIQLINISSLSVFKKYSKAYKIYRDLYDYGSFGLEVINIENEKAHKIHKLFLTNGDFCYVNQIDEKYSNLIALGSIHKLKENSKLVKSQVNEEIGHRMIQVIMNYESYEGDRIIIDGKTFLNSEIHVMGILNVTPDSFSDGGKYLNKEFAVKHAQNMISTGADIIDIGGESTRPGASEVSVDDELQRVIPVIESIKSLYPEQIISIDTTKSKVADAAVSAGASIINDISGGLFDEKVFEVASKYDVPLIIMHIKGKPENMQLNPVYDDTLNEIYKSLFIQIEKAKRAGVKKIIVDPGFGFGKELHHNYEILDRLDELKSLGYPIMVGLSRKSMIGNALDLKIENRESASLIAETIAVTRGARFIRTHDVENTLQLKKMYNLINNPGMLLNV